MIGSPTEPSAIVARELSRRPPEGRVAFLTELLANTAAGIVLITGDKDAAERCYRLGDAIVRRGAP